MTQFDQVGPFVDAFLIHAPCAFQLMQFHVFDVQEYFFSIYSLCGGAVAWNRRAVT